MKNPEVIELIKIELGVCQSEVNTLTEKISALENVIDIFEPKQSPAVQELIQKSKKKTVKKSKHEPKLEHIKNGGMKFSSFVLSILQNKPQKTFTSKELKGIVAGAIENGSVIFSGKKDLVSTISASLHSQYLLGKVDKLKDEHGMSYQFKSKDKIAHIKTSDDELMIDRILEYTKDKFLTAKEISQKLYMDVRYTDIAKNLNGTLNTCTRNCLDKLLQDKRIDQDEDGKYFSI